MASVNSPLSSILKSSRVNVPNPKRNSFQVRFETPAVQFDIASILVDYIDGHNEARYIQLLGLKNDPNVNDTFLLTILQQVNKSISLLVPKVELFVDALLSVSWTSRPQIIIEEYLNFIQSLVSAHSYYCKSVIRMLVLKFSLAPETDSSIQYVHEVLKMVMGLIPLSRTIVMDTLSDCFPYIVCECEQQVNYVKNLLHLTEYCQMSTSYILNIIIGRLIKLDSRAPREELLKVLGHQEMMEEEESAPLTAAKILDQMMELLFDFSSKKCASSWQIHRTYFNELYSSFVSLIMPTMGIHHTHFLMLYVCSTKPTLYKTFTDRLWMLFQTPSSPLNVRKSAADYLASFLGKANFVPMSIVIEYLTNVCQWIHSYIDRQNKGEGAATFKIRAHSAFYAASHVLFYVVAARHADFHNNRKHVASLQAMDLTRIVSCNLNPLRYCHATTVRQFAESASHLQVAYCHTIMIRNQRLCLPEANESSLTLDTEYPFEKYLLPNSSRYITSLIIDKPIGRDDSLYDSDQVMEELLSESPRVGGFMQHFLG